MKPHVLLADLFLRLTGWRYDNAPPPFPKFVMLGAPHTSTWDFPMVLATLGHFEMPLRWMAKDSMFRFPFGRLNRALGGIPVDRTRRSNAVAQAIEQFARHSHFILAVAPEGTRRRTEGWKTGFWHIARGAGVPIVPAYVDGRRWAAGFGPPLMPGDDLDADLATLAAFYATITPIKPANFGPVRALPGNPSRT